MRFVLLSPGTFLMGSSSTEPHRDKNEVLHEVKLTKAFYIMETEVTRGQYKALTGSAPFLFVSCSDDCPVERVSWYECQSFIEALNKLGEGTYRLPTEAEWEYACRAGTHTAYSWGDTIDCSRALYENNTIRDFQKCVPYIEKRGFKPNSPAPVKSYPSNPWGLFGMSGNLWEWCQDWYAPYPKGEVTDPQGPPWGDARVRRGGSWFKYGYYCRCANRNYADPADRYRTTGFRLVREHP